MKKILLMIQLSIAFSLRCDTSITSHITSSCQSSAYKHLYCLAGDESVVDTREAIDSYFVNLSAYKTNSIKFHVSNLNMTSGFLLIFNYTRNYSMINLDFYVDKPKFTLHLKTLCTYVHRETVVFSNFHIIFNDSTRMPQDFVKISCMNYKQCHAHPNKVCLINRCTKYQSASINLIAKSKSVFVDTVNNVPPGLHLNINLNFLDSSLITTLRSTHKTAATTRLGNRISSVTTLRSTTTSSRYFNTSDGYKTDFQTPTKTPSSTNGTRNVTFYSLYFRTSDNYTIDLRTRTKMAPSSDGMRNIFKMAKSRELLIAGVVGSLLLALAVIPLIAYHFVKKKQSDDLLCKNSLSLSHSSGLHTSPTHTSSAVSLDSVIRETATAAVDELPVG